MADLIIWNTFNSYGWVDGVNVPLFPVPKVAVRPSGPHQIANWLKQFGYEVVDSYVKAQLSYYENIVYTMGVG